MGITKRFVYLLSFGIVPLLLGIALQNPFTIFVLYNLICGGLLLVDYFISPSGEEIEIEATGEENLSIYEREAISLQVHNRSDYSLHLELKDEIPDFHFEVEEKVVKDTLLPQEKKTLSYYVKPTKRGAFTFKNLHLRYEGRLRLCRKQLKINLEREYKVYPNLKNLRKYRLSICNNRLFKQGQRNLRTMGRGTSFESLREYVYGDEFRKINWQATARGNKLIVNQYEPEKNQHVYSFIDIGRPMSYSIRGNRKLDLAINTALVLTDLVNQNGDRSGLLLFNTEVENMIPPGKGIGHRNKILDALYHIHSTNDTSNYIEAFQHFKKKERNRSIVFIFTDFSTIEEAEDLLKVLPIVQKNNVVVVMLIKNESLEELSNQTIADKKQLFDKGVALEYLEERKKIINLLNRKGAFCIECPAEELEITAVNKYIQIKNNTFL